MDDREPSVEESLDFSESTSKWKWWAIGAGVLLTMAIIALSWFLYTLGGDDQSALERLRDIAVIYIVLLSMIIVILLAAITAALIFLVFQIKDRVIPLLEEGMMTAKRVRGTTEFVTEEAVKPILSVAGKYAKLRAMQRTVTKGTKPPKA